MKNQGSISGRYLRGGTSNGLFVQSKDVPVKKDLLDDLLMEIFGTPDPLQIDGIGGSKSHTSKFMSVGPSTREDTDIEYTFGQVGVNKPNVGWSGNCGNLTSAVGMFAILEDIVAPQEPITEVKLYNTNTNTFVTQNIPVVDGEPAVSGDYSIDGVPGTGPKIKSTFHNPAGRITGSVLPTGNPTTNLDIGDEEVTVSIVDATNLVVFVHAEDVNMDGAELPDEIDADEETIQKFEDIRSAAADYIGVENIPAIASIAEPMDYECSVDKSVKAEEIDITSRIISLQPHHAYAMTGAMCLGAAMVIPGTIPNKNAQLSEPGNVTIGHPKGTINIGVDTDETAEDIHINSITNYRTARPMMNSEVYFRYDGRLSKLQDSD